MTDIRLLIVGTGGMANAHAEAFAAIKGVKLVGGVDTDPKRLAAFCKKHKVANGFASIEDALAWGQFDAVSNVTPDAVHKATTLPFLGAGKHVLCEKPLATNATDAYEMAEAARASGVVNMVNLTYRRGGGLVRAAEMVAEGMIGEVRHFEASYLQSWLSQPAWGDWRTESQWLWRLSTAHGSLGVLGDVGVHILDFTTFVAGAMPSNLSCRLTTFDKAPGGKIDDYVLDANDSFAMHMRLQNGAVGVVHASRFATGHLNDLSLQIFGTLGGLEVTERGGKTGLRSCLGKSVGKGSWKRETPPQVPDNFANFISAIRGECVPDPDFARGAALQEVLDQAVRSDEKGSCDVDIAYS